MISSLLLQHSLKIVIQMGWATCIMLKDAVNQITQLLSFRVSFLLKLELTLLGMKTYIFK